MNTRRRTSVRRPMNSSMRIISTETRTHFADLARNYGWCGGGSLTTAEFTFAGVRYTAHRFWREDLGCRGIELYRNNYGRASRKLGMQTLLRMIPETGDIWRAVDLRARHLIRQAEALATPTERELELDRGPRVVAANDETEAEAAPEIELDGLTRGRAAAAA